MYGQLGGSVWIGGTGFGGAGLGGELAETARELDALRARMVVPAVPAMRASVGSTALVTTR